MSNVRPQEMHLVLRRLLAISCLLWFCGALGADAWNATPEALVREFQNDYLAWNDLAMQQDEKLGTERAMANAERAYDVLLRKFCLPTFRGQPIAYGTRSSHNPSTEKIVKTAFNGIKAEVRTEIQITKTYIAEYSYELVQADGRWYLTQIYLVDPDGKYPGL